MTSEKQPSSEPDSLPSQPVPSDITLQLQKAGHASLVVHAQFSKALGAALTPQHVYKFVNVGSSGSAEKLTKSESGHHVSLGIDHTSGLHIIAIGPLGGKIVGYKHGLTGLEPIYAGSSDALKLSHAKSLAQAHNDHPPTTLQAIQSWLALLGIAFKGDNTGVGVYIPKSVAASIGLTSIAGTPPEALVHYSIAELLPHVGKPIIPPGSIAIEHAAEVAAGEVGEKDPFPPLHTLTKQEDPGKFEGSHGNQHWKDAKGHDFVFKAKDKVIARAEEAASRIGTLILGEGKVPHARVVQLGSQTGALIKVVEGTPFGKEGSGYDQAKLVQYAPQLAAHAVLDWLISNHDAHGENFLIDAGKVVGIDKGQAWKFLGSDKLAPNYKPNASKPVHLQLWEQLPKGKIDKAKVIDAIVDALNAADKISDDQYRSLIAPYVQAAGGSKSKDLEAKMLARKHALRADFTQLLSTVLGTPVDLTQKTAAQAAAPKTLKIDLVPPPTPIQSSGPHKIVPQVAGWPIKHANVTVHNPGSPVPPHIKQPAKYPGPGYHATILNNGGKFQIEVLATPEALTSSPLIKVTYPDGSSALHSSWGNACESFALFNKGLDVKMSNADKAKLTPKIGVSGIALLKLDHFGPLLVQAGAVPQAAQEPKIEAPKQEAPAPSPKAPTHPPIGLVTDTAALPVKVQLLVIQALSDPQGAPGKPKPGTVVHTGDGFYVVFTSGGPHVWGPAIYKPGLVGSATKHVPESLMTPVSAPPAPLPVVAEAAPSPSTKIDLPTQPAPSAGPLPSFTKVTKQLNGKSYVLTQKPEGGFIVSYNQDDANGDPVKITHEIGSISGACDLVWCYAFGHGTPADYKKKTGKKAVPSGGGWKFWGVKPGAAAPPAVEATSPMLPNGQPLQEPATGQPPIEQAPAPISITTSQDVAKTGGMSNWAWFDGKTYPKSEILKKLDFAPYGTKLGYANANGGSVQFLELKPGGWSFEGVGTELKTDYVKTVLAQDLVAEGLAYVEPAEKLAPSVLAPQTTTQYLGLATTIDDLETLPVGYKIQWTSTGGETLEAKKTAKDSWFLTSDPTDDAAGLSGLTTKQLWGEVKHHGISGPGYEVAAVNENGEVLVAATDIPAAAKIEVSEVSQTPQPKTAHMTAPPGAHPEVAAVMAFLWNGGAVLVKPKTAPPYCPPPKVWIEIQSSSGPILMTPVQYMPPPNQLDVTWTSVNTKTGAVSDGPLEKLAAVHGFSEQAVWDWASVKWEGNKPIEPSTTPAPPKPTFLEAFPHLPEVKADPSFKIKPGNTQGYWLLCHDKKPGASSDTSEAAIEKLLEKYGIVGTMKPKGNYLGAWVPISPTWAAKLVDVPVPLSAMGLAESVSPATAAYPLAPEAQPPKSDKPAGQSNWQWFIDKDLKDAGAKLEAAPKGTKLFWQNSLGKFTAVKIFEKWHITNETFSKADGECSGGTLGVVLNHAEIFPGSLMVEQSAIDGGGLLGPAPTAPEVIAPQPSLTLDELEAAPLGTSVVVSNGTIFTKIKGGMSTHWIAHTPPGSKVLAGIHSPATLAAQNAVFAPAFEAKSAASVLKPTKINPNWKPYTIGAALSEKPLGSIVTYGDGSKKFVVAKSTILGTTKMLVEVGTSNVFKPVNFASKFSTLGIVVHAAAPNAALLDTPPGGGPKVTIQAPKVKKATPAPVIAKPFVPIPLDPQKQAKKDWASAHPAISPQDARHLGVVLAKHSVGDVYARKDGADFFLGDSSQATAAKLQAAVGAGSIVETPWGPMLQISQKTVIDASPEAGWITGPDGGLYPFGTTFTETVEAGKSLKEEVNGTDYFNKVDGYKAPDKKFDAVLKWKGGASTITKTVEDFKAKHGLTGPTIIGSQNIIVPVTKAELEQPFGPPTKKVHAIPPAELPQLKSKPLTGVAAHPPAPGSVALDNRSDLSSAHEVIPGNNGYSIRFGAGGILMEGQLKVHKIKFPDGTSVTRVTGELSHEPPQLDASLPFKFYGAVKLDADGKVVGSALFDQGTGTYAMQHTEVWKTGSHYSSGRDLASGARVSVFNKGSHIEALRRTFAVDIPEGTDPEKALAEAMTALDIDPAEAMRPLTEDDEKIVKKMLAVRSIIGPSGYSKVEGMGLHKLSAAEKHKKLDAELKKQGYDPEHIISKPLRTTDGGIFQLEMDDLDPFLGPGKKVEGLTNGVPDVAGIMRFFVQSGGAGFQTSCFSGNCPKLDPSSGSKAATTSAHADMVSGGTAGKFFRAIGANQPTHGSVGLATSSGPKLVIKPTVLRRTGWYAHGSDQYGTQKGGDPRSRKDAVDVSSPYNEFVVTNIDHDDYAGVIVSSASDKKKIIEGLQQLGHSDWKGVPFDQFIIVGSTSNIGPELSKLALLK